MYQTNEVFAPVAPSKVVPGLVRVIETVGLDTVVLIAIDERKLTAPFRVSYALWVDWISSGQIEKVFDPFITLSAVPAGLTLGATERFKQVILVVDHLSLRANLFHQSRTLPHELGVVAGRLGVNQRTVKRWALLWLQAGRNPMAAVSRFAGRDLGIQQGLFSPVEGEPKGDPEALLCKQKIGLKRGPKGCQPNLAFPAPAHEVAKKIGIAYSKYVRPGKMTRWQAYNQMLIKEYEIPEAYLEELLINPALMQKFRPPSLRQFKYRCRQLEALHKQILPLDYERPRGQRGKVKDQVHGPGFYEIDATFIQVQLVSCLTKADLVSRPLVYLVVDIFSGAIVGYTVSLENPSWAVAALALHNTFSDKREVFEKLNLPYTSSDWPCHHLPVMLRADRAELVSDMGQDFANSGIRIEITPSMTPIAKGTVEGKNSELKASGPGRFNLPGAYKKELARRAPDGKKAAALDLNEFEKILVETIMELNRAPVARERIPIDAIPEGAKVASRIGLFEWGLMARYGFTSNKPPNFAYEHLLMKDTGRVTPGGLKFREQIYQCDELRKGQYLAVSVGKNIPLMIAYHPLYAAEIYFFDAKKGKWHTAYNADDEILRSKASFAEVRELNFKRERLRDQASLIGRHTTIQRQAELGPEIKSAVAKVAKLKSSLHRPTGDIRKNRDRERAHHRAAGFNGALHGDEPHPEMLVGDDENLEALEDSDGSEKPVLDLLSQWEKLNARNRK